MVHISRAPLRILSQRMSITKHEKLEGMFALLENQQKLSRSRGHLHPRPMLLKLLWLLPLRSMRNMFLAMCLRIFARSLPIMVSRKTRGSRSGRKLVRARRPPRRLRHWQGVQVPGVYIIIYIYILYIYGVILLYIYYIFRMVIMGGSNI